MAGTNVALVRPKAAQDQNKIAAGSPLAIQGIFLEIIRERFRTDAGIDWAWDPDPTKTGILIEAGYNEETESRNQAPAIYVIRLQSVPARWAIGDRAGMHNPTDLEAFNALMTVSLSIECVSNDAGESAILGDIVQFMLICSQDVIEREFGFHSVGMPILGQTSVYDRDNRRWATINTMEVQFQIRWNQTPIRPLVNQVRLRLNNEGGGYFQDLVTTSLTKKHT